MVNRRCIACNSEFNIKPAYIRRGRGKYCSMSCRKKESWGKTVSCYRCGVKVFRQKRFIDKNKNFFCSRKCSIDSLNQNRIEEKSPNWKFGEYSYRNILLRSNQRKICRLCSIDDADVLIVHHIDKNRRHNSLANLVWLCCNCHHLVHHYKQESRRLEEVLNKK